MRHDRLTIILVMAGLTALILPSILTAQITFERTYGGFDVDFGQWVQQTAEGGYVVTGCTKSYGPGGPDVYLVRTDSLGDTMWTQTYGGDTVDIGASVQQTFDGGFIVAGWTMSFGAGRFDVYLVKTDADGDTQWTRTFGGTENDAAYQVQQTADSGYILAGLTASSGADSQDVWLIKTDANGDTLWTRMFGEAGNDGGSSVQQTRDGGYIVTGFTRSFGAGNYDVYLIKTDARGDTMWTRTFGGAARDHGLSVQQTMDGGYIVAGTTESYGAGGRDVYLIKTDGTGAGRWIQVYGDTGDDEALSVCPTADSGFIVAGSTTPAGSSASDVYLIRTDANGHSLWTGTYGGASYDDGCSIQPTTDGGYIIAGQTMSYGAGLIDVYLIKTDSAGRVSAVAEPKVDSSQARLLGPTIVRGVLRIGDRGPTTGDRAELLDITGRKVLDLHPGANDVRHVAPGVCFVREAQAQAQVQTVRKVVITR